MFPTMEEIFCIILMLSLILSNRLPRMATSTFTQLLSSGVVAQELCESRGGHPRLLSLMVSVDVKQHFNELLPLDEILAHG